MSTKMKGLLKGLRYISQIFDEEKEPEMQIGFPTDVKHVAHIGWDGPSVNTPSWMNNFKAPEFSSAPIDMAGDAKVLPAANCAYEESSRRSSREQNSQARDSPELPKSSRRQSLNGMLSSGSPSRDKSDRTKPSRRHQLRQQQQDPSLGIDSPTRNLPAIPKKSRRKKSKDSSTGGSTRSSTRSKGNSSSTTYASPFSDPGSGGSGSMLKNSDFCPTSPLPLRQFKEGEEKRCAEIS